MAECRITPCSWSVALVVVSCVFWRTIEGHQQLGCSSVKTSAVSFTVDSHRNQTGHWLSKVQVNLGPRNESNERWSVSVQQKMVECDGRINLVYEADISAPPPRVGPDYELFPGVGYYKFHKTPVTWEQGRQICEKEGAHLAIINSQRESEVLKLLFSRNKDIPNTTHSGSAAIGFHDQYTEGDYITIFGTPLASTGFTTWSQSPPQPDNYEASANHPGEDCGAIHVDGLLNDVGCSKLIAFICEQEL